MHNYLTQFLVIEQIELLSLLLLPTDTAKILVKKCIRLKREGKGRLNKETENTIFQTNSGRWKADKVIEIKILIPLKGEGKRQPLEFHLTK